MDLIDDIVNLFKSLLDYLGIDANNLVSKLAYHFWLFFSLLFFCHENVVCCIQVHFRPDYFMEANNMDQDQTALKEQSDLGPYCLQYRLPKNIRGADNKSRVLWAKG